MVNGCVAVAEGSAANLRNVRARELFHVAVLMDGFPILIELAGFKGHGHAADRAVRWRGTCHNGLQCSRGCTRDRRPERSRGSDVYFDFETLVGTLQGKPTNSMFAIEPSGHRLRIEDSAAGRSGLRGQPALPLG